MNRLVVVVIVAVLTWACGGSPVAPTAPSAPPSPPAPPVVLTPPHSLSGVVFEVTAAGARVPLPGVEVEEYARHTVAKTDESGVYRHALPSGGMTFFGFEHAGFQSSRNGTIVNGDTRFDIQAVRLPGQLHSLFGVVSEVLPTGEVVPVAGVEVEENNRHATSTTAGDGFYRIPFPSSDRAIVSIWKAGYEASQSLVTVSGHTRFDIRAIRR